MKTLIQTLFLIFLLSPPVFAAQLSGIRILLADSDDRLLTQITLMLKNAGADVTGVHDGEKALEILTQRTFDILVTDNFVGSSRLFGVNVICELRRQKNDLPIILHTSSASASIITDALEFRASAVVQKDDNISNLIATILTFVLIPEDRQHSTRNNSGVCNNSFILPANKSSSSPPRKPSEQHE